MTVDPQGRLVVKFARSFDRDACSRPAMLRQIEQALAEVCGGRVGLVLEVDEAAAQAAAPPPPKSMRQRQAEIVSDPFVQKAIDLFAGDPNRLKYIPPREK